ncbi:MAG: GlmL-related ornithine degradation protein [Bacillota bacterium]
MTSIDLLVAEIGSTTTKVNAFALGGGGAAGPVGPAFVGQGRATTSVAQGDVVVGLRGAIDDLGRQLGGHVRWGRMMASSSAAGGLRMSVHGLVRDMTVKAAREAALGAGAILRFVSAGDLTDTDLEAVRKVKPNIILLAGGVDYGERATVVANARRLAALGLPAPVVYAGNVVARDEVVGVLQAAGICVYPVDNVYPRLDEMVIEPTRRAIQRVFEEHIVGAPGMDRVRELVDGPIIPTPGAVMNMAVLLRAAIGDLVAVDVGGATTDVHSVTEGSEEIARMLVAPEPVAKRTVEGDLGVFVNAPNVIDLVGPAELAKAFGGPEAELVGLARPLPATDRERAFSARLTRQAVRVGLLRHAGRLRYLYGPTGRTVVSEGKDLTAVKWLIGTGGALTRLPGGEEALAAMRVRDRGRELLPGLEAAVALDRDYIMASCGVLSAEYAKEAVALMQKSLGIPGPFAANPAPPGPSPTKEADELAPPDPTD